MRSGKWLRPFLFTNHTATLTNSKQTSKARTCIIKGECGVTVSKPIILTSRCLDVAGKNFNVVQINKLQSCMVQGQSSEDPTVCT